MDDYESLGHPKWECKYHIVFIPKCRRKTLFGQIRQHLWFKTAQWYSRGSARMGAPHGNAGPRS
jgi:REP element-mobilizing transposase RayT